MYFMFYWIVYIQVTSVDVMTESWTGRPRLKSWQGRGFFFATAFGQAHPASCQIGAGGCSPVAWGLPLASIWCRVGNAWTCTSTPPCVSMAWYLI